MLTCLAPGTAQVIPGLFADTLQQIEPRPIPLGPTSQVYLNSSLLPPPFLHPPRKLKLLEEPRGGVGSLQYCHYFRPTDEPIPLSSISWNSNHLPDDFLDQLFDYEEWGEVEFTEFYFPPPPTAPVECDCPTLSLWCPDNSPDPSPDHSLTVCNSSDDSTCSSGPSFCLEDWHSSVPPGRSVWQCYHTHSPCSNLLTYLFPRLLHLWLTVWPLEQRPFADAVSFAYLALFGTHSPGIAAWRFPPHSLATHALRLLLHTFTCPGLAIEGFGYGSGLGRTRGHPRSSVLPPVLDPYLPWRYGTPSPHL